MRALVTGGTGFVGKRLISKLDNPVVLSRDPAKAEKALSAYKVKAYAWEPTSGHPPAEAFEGIDVVFHLAGDSVADGRWTKAKKERMRESRVQGTRHLVQVMEQISPRPRVLISASAVGIYGDRPSEILTETSPPASDYLAEICESWEREAQAAENFGVRVVNPRIGIVLGEKGGALGKMLLPFQLGVGSPLGSGKQMMPWIHIDDLVGLMLYAANHENVRGPVNATAPKPVSNTEFTHTLGKALGRPTFFPAVPGFVLNIALGEFARVLLASQNVVPTAIQAAGYQFQWPELLPALNNIVGKKP